MEFFDMHKMILERLPRTSCKQAARVNRAYRGFIENNEENMRELLITIERAEIRWTFCPGFPIAERGIIYNTFARKTLLPECLQRMSSDRMMRYVAPSHLQLHSYLCDHICLFFEALENLSANWTKKVQSISWWMRKIDQERLFSFLKKCINLRDIRMKYSCESLNIHSSDEFNHFLEGLLHIGGIFMDGSEDESFLVNDSTLDMIRIASLSTPLVYIKIVNMNMRITFSALTRFLEEICMISVDEKESDMKAFYFEIDQLHGTTGVNWNQWLLLNTTNIHIDYSTNYDDGTYISRTCRFVFRERKFGLKIYSFINNFPLFVN